MAVDMWAHGDRDAAIIVPLSHDCYLRADEALGLHVGDFTDATKDPQLSALAIVH